MAIEKDIPDPDGKNKDDFFYYKNQETKDRWYKEGLVPPLENTMVYFLIGVNQLTVVTDEELTMAIRNCFAEV